MKKKIKRSKRIENSDSFLAGMSFGIFLIGLMMAIIFEEIIIFISSLPALACFIGLAVKEE